MITDVLSQIDVELLNPYLTIMQAVTLAVSSWNSSCVQEYPAQLDVYDCQQFDFIIVGAGSAGSVLANRLTEVKDWSVLLIEAGDQPLDVANNPGLSILLGMNLPIWGYNTVEDKFSSQAHKTKSIHTIAGKMIGGSSANNFMFYARGNKADYENWVTEGNEGWDWKNVTYYFKKSERLDDPIILKSDTADLHNDDGYLGVSRSLVDELQTTIYFNAFKENGYQYHEDTNGYQQIGYSNTMYTIDSKLRQSTGLAFIIPVAGRENLHILKNTYAKKVIFDGKRAKGVEVKLPDGNIINIKVEKGVLLSADALNSPQLLILSGVGPVDYLKEMNITVNIDSSNVGKNLQDHMIVAIVLTGRKNMSSKPKNFEILNNLAKFPIPLITGFAAVDNIQTYPDYQVTAFPTPTAGIFPTIRCSSVMELEDRICIVLSKYSEEMETLLTGLTFLHPKSRGYVGLMNPEEKPALYTGYFSNLMDNFVTCIDDYISVVDRSVLQSINSLVADLNVEQCENVTFGSTHDYEYWKCFVLNVAGTMYHPLGTCAMGHEGSGVVDERLRVWGADGLRVVDAGMMPSITSGNTNTLVIMIAEKAADRSNMITDVLSQIEVALFSSFLTVVQAVTVAVSAWNWRSVQEYPAQLDAYDGQQFDFIIVGAGSAGSVLANRLTEVKNWSVLLIEAGDQSPYVANSPGLSLISIPTLPDWRYNTVDDNFSSQAHKTKSILITRGKMISGCSANNFMFYVRGNKADYENWVEQGNEGWDWKNVTYYFKKSERLDDPIILKSDTADLHNDDGYLGVSRSLVDESQTTIYFNAFKENGYEYHEDTNGYQQIGYSNPMFTIDDKLRQSAGLAFIKPVAGRENLKILKNSYARKVIFDGKRAIGVEVKLPDGNIINIKAEKEVILSAGALNSPQLLMLSGVGPVDHLKEMNITVNIDSPNVGKNLQDHMIVPIVLTGRKNLLSILENLNVLGNLDKFPVPTIMGFVAVDKNQTYPDYQVTAVPTPRAGPIPTLLCSQVMQLEDRICIAMSKYSLKMETLFAFITFLHPKSRGYIELKSADPEEKPVIYTGYFSNQDDIDNFATYIEDYISVVNTTVLKNINSAVADLNVEQCKNVTFGSHEYWKCFVLNVAGTMYHQSGTCAMGHEGSGVVDERLRVWGADALRVVDAGVMPSITSGNTNAPVIMIAEKAADMIKVDYGIN